MNRAKKLDILLDNRINEARMSTFKWFYNWNTFKILNICIECLETLTNNLKFRIQSCQVLNIFVTYILAYMLAFYVRHLIKKEYIYSISMSNKKYVIVLDRAIILKHKYKKTIIKVKNN